MNELQNQKGSRPMSQKAFELAECRFKKSLEVSESRGNEHGAASTYAELGTRASRDDARRGRGDAFCAASKAVSKAARPSARRAVRTPRLSADRPARRMTYTLRE